eukprot:1159016-Pelagomonas_calceolata.AAC.4
MGISSQDRSNRHVPLRRALHPAAARSYEQHSKEAFPQFIGLAALILSLRVSLLNTGCSSSQ